MGWALQGVIPWTSPSFSIAPVFLPAPPTTLSSSFLQLPLKASTVCPVYTSGPSHLEQAFTTSGVLALLF